MNCGYKDKKTVRLRERAAHVHAGHKHSFKLEWQEAAFLSAEFALGVEKNGRRGGCVYQSCRTFGNAAYNDPKIATSENQNMV